MYSHIKVGDLIRISYLSHKKDVLQSKLFCIVLEKDQYSHTNCTFVLLDSDGKKCWHVANANDPYKNIYVIQQG
jgi:hypothetical protein